MALSKPEIALEYVHGLPVLPFDIQNPNKYLPTLFTIRKCFTSRLGADVIFRFLGSTGLKLYLHFQRWDLYCMKLNVGDENIGTPWLLGSGDTNRHIGVSESYRYKPKVGYSRLQDAVDAVIGSFKYVTVASLKEIKGEEDWRNTLSHDLTTILFMSIEAARLPWLGDDYYLYDMKPLSEVRDTTDGEDKLVHAWDSISKCSFMDGGYDVSSRPMGIPITTQLVADAKTDSRLARDGVAIPCIQHIEKYKKALEDAQKKGAHKLE